MKSKYLVPFQLRFHVFAAIPSNSHNILLLFGFRGDLFAALHEEVLRSGILAAVSYWEAKYIHRVSRHWNRWGGTGLVEPNSFGIHSHLEMIAVFPHLMHPCRYIALTVGLNPAHAAELRFQSRLTLRILRSKQFLQRRILNSQTLNHKRYFTDRLDIERMINFYVANMVSIFQVR